ncbi:P-loop containing nucleoside triphosphate hydrolase protein [Lyophyllum atratum]|nr:P-loop containing nucleoside triphosphate hydrolase protein [Lyophyllum atratum]
MGKAKGAKKGTKWREEIKEYDLFLEDPKETDRVIALMGSTGAGKSTFVNSLMGKDVASVGNDLESHTKDVQHFTFPDPAFPERRIVVIDTPGFDDTYINNREILRRIAVWLARSYNASMKLAGIIYLHKITNNRVAGTTRNNFDLFEKLCGKNASEKIVLVTTMWSLVSKEAGERREEQLRGKFWKDMLALGSTMIRLDDSDMQRSAQNIIKFILTKDILDHLQIQYEMVDLDKLLEETEAARLLSSELHHLLHRQEEKASELRKKRGDWELQQALVELDAQIRATLSEIKSLNVPLSLRIKRFFGFGQSPTAS